MVTMKKENRMGTGFVTRQVNYREDIPEMLRGGWSLEEGIIESLPTREEVDASAAGYCPYGARQAEVEAQVAVSRKVDLQRSSVSQGVYGRDMDDQT